jgi:hypothetical protein
MAYLFGGPGSARASRREEAFAFEARTSGVDIVAVIRDGAASLDPVDTGTLRALFDVNLAGLEQEKTQSLLAVEAAERDNESLRQEIRKTPVQQGSYRNVIALQSGNQTAPVSVTEHPHGDTPAEFVASSKRLSGSIAVPAAKVLIHSAAVTLAMAVDMAAVDQVLSDKLMTGAETFSAGPIVAMSATAVGAGYTAFRKCSERVEKLLTVTSRIAIAPFLIGAGLLIAGGTIEALGTGSMGGAADASSLAEAGSGFVRGLVGTVAAALGDFGLAAALGSVPVLSFAVAHGGLRSIRENGERLLNAFHLRRRAGEIEKRSKDAAGKKAGALARVREFEGLIHDLPSTIANLVVVTVAPSLAEARGLLTQKRLYPSGSANFAPDVLSEHVAAMNEAALAEAIERLSASADAERNTKALREYARANTRNRKGK